MSKKKNHNSKKKQISSAKQNPSGDKNTADKITKPSVDDNSVFFVTEQNMPQQYKKTKKQAVIDKKQEKLNIEREKINAEYKRREEKLTAKKKKHIEDIAEYQEILQEKYIKHTDKIQKKFEKQQSAFEKLKTKKVSKIRIKEEQEKLERISKKNKSQSKKEKEKIKTAVAKERSAVEDKYKKKFDKLSGKLSEEAARLDEKQSQIDAMQSELNKKNQSKQDKIKEKEKKRNDSVQLKIEKQQAQKQAVENKKRAEIEKRKVTLNPINDTENPEAIAEYINKLAEIEKWNLKFSNIMQKVGICVIAFVIIFAVLWNTEAARISLEGKDCYDISVNVFGMTSRIREVGTAAILKKEKIKFANGPVAVFRLIDDMYTNPYDGVAYGENEIIHIGVYGAKIYTDVFEKNDFSLGRADMYVSRAKRGDRKNAVKNNSSIGRCAIIREYTEKYGGEYESNFETLKNVPLKQIIYREQVTEEATQAVESIFNIFTTGDNVPMVINDGSTPAPTAVPIVPPMQNTVIEKKKYSKNSSPKSYGKTENKTEKKKNSDYDTVSSDENETSKATEKPSEATSAPTAKPISPIKEVARPTANPIKENLE